MNNIDKVKEYIGLKYKGMTRRSGEPVVNHSLHMCEILKNNGYNECYQIIALLHDVIEDTNTSFDDLKNDLENIINNEIIKAVESLTKYDHETLEQSIAKAKNNEFGRIIKGVDRLQNAITTYKNLNSQEFISGFIFKTVVYYIPALEEVNNPFLNELLVEIHRLTKYLNSEAREWLKNMINNDYKKYCI